MKATNKPLLLVEDDLVDMMTMRRALKDIRCVNPLVQVENVVEALAYLRDVAIETPCLILLDINTPVMNGIEFLQEAKRDDGLRRYPVVVLHSFNRDVAGYMAKPVNYQRFVEVMRSIDPYWSLSELP